MYSQHKKRKITLIIAACAAVLLAAGATIGILYFLNKPSHLAQNNAPASSTPASLIATFQNTPPSSLVNMPHQQVTASDVTVSVKPNSASYGITVQSEAAVLFSGRESKEKIDRDTVLHDTSAVFAQAGLEKSVTYPSGITYAGKGLVCQLDAQTEPISVVTIACVKDEIVQKAYQAIEKLVSLYNEQAGDNEKIQEPLQISRTVLERDTVTGTILSVQYTESAKAGSYLFGAINGQWQYVTNLTGGISTGKTNIPEAALPVIKDAKWKGVLVELTGVEG